mmetsp:Transcript_2314/g.3156  ORF Transcript_2314/g.3156 Transcript_2314/m.3156 type:complete len:121 (+) Transcript_2314:373-735(+)|eukprot:CAMPEP_0185585924 /NCGR_PEP_ID=MMETSP0434-20130131/41729_1 /TAXON_ID=626734 ORGANISM="Favella taraikaensis, Strain Fe Narragansett Bay" /NCGR_SAMPLE_ID=MMETSP0434 /ASSEMBLY_ACC=CAM_ASM_000379 /LENGTH=120 /DNA_ID=CAMNT_0028206653 /DNA_START=341 /DNA_END=703 /DNA_ORIENTATION=+
MISVPSDNKEHGRYQLEYEFRHMLQTQSFGTPTKLTILVNKPSSSELMPVPQESSKVSQSTGNPPGLTVSNDLKRVQDHFLDARPVSSGEFFPSSSSGRLSINVKPAKSEDAKFEEQSIR